MGAGIALVQQGAPVVVLPAESSSGDYNHLSVWDAASGWSTPLSYPSAYRGNLLVDSNGVMTSVGTAGGGPGMSRSFDSTQSWKGYAQISAPGASTKTLQR